MSIKHIIILSAVMLVLTLASIGTSFFLMTSMLDTRMAEMSEALGIEPEEEEVAEEEPEELAPAIYVPLEPFVVNFVQEGALRYLQVTMELMSRDQQVVDQVNASLPEIRNSLILLMSDHSYADLSSREGKEEIRNAVLAEVNSIIEHENGIESVFLTGFLMQ